MTLDMLHPEDDAQWTQSSLERARRGKDRERDVVLHLTRCGQRAANRFEVIESQRRFEVKDRDGVVLMVGKMDGRLKFSDGSKPIFDVKSGDSIRNADTLEDLDRSTWTKHHVDQLLAYLLADAEPWGLLILDKPDGPTLLPVVLEEHLERAESFLVEARKAIDARFARTPLPAFTDNRAECKRCPHLGKTCAPPLDYGSGVQVITDPLLIEAAEKREALKPSAKEYERLDKTVKTALRGVESAIMGDFLVSGKWSGAKKLVMTDEQKAAFQIYDEKARFLLDIERNPQGTEGV